METNNTWLANYYYRTKALSTKNLATLEKVGVTPKHKDRKVKHYTLKEYIEFLGMKEAAEKFGCSEASVKAWRYGYRQPSIKHTHAIIKATEGRLDYESIYGRLSEIV